MSSAELIASLGKALAELDAATRDAQRASLPFLKSKLERVAHLQSSFNAMMARGLSDLAADIERVKAGRADG